MVGDQTRGELHRTTAGQFRPTDNSPAWLMHHLLFNAVDLPAASDLESAMAEWPCHMFTVGKLKVRALNGSGWHIAHLADVKDRNTDWRRWSRDDLRRRFLRNLHPCNYVPLPNANWQTFGSDRRIIEFFAHAYKEIYSDIWESFAKAAGISSDAFSASDSSVRYDITGKAEPRVSLFGDAPVIQGERH